MSLSADIFIIKGNTLPLYQLSHRGISLFFCNIFIMVKNSVFARVISLSLNQVWGLLR